VRRKGEERMASGRRSHDPCHSLTHGHREWDSSEEKATTGVELTSGSCVIERMTERGSEETRCGRSEGTRRSGTNFSVPFMSENMAHGGDGGAKKYLSSL
jgi:hypothetical protein